MPQLFILSSLFYSEFILFFLFFAKYVFFFFFLPSYLPSLLHSFIHLFIPLFISPSFFYFLSYFYPLHIIYHLSSCHVLYFLFYFSGLRKAEALKQSVRRKNSSIGGRNEILEKRILGPVTWTNAIGIHLQFADVVFCIKSSKIVVIMYQLNFDIFLTPHLTCLYFTSFAHLRDFLKCNRS